VGQALQRSPRHRRTGNWADTVATAGLLAHSRNLVGGVQLRLEFFALLLQFANLGIEERQLVLVSAISKQMNIPTNTHTRRWGLRLKQHPAKSEPLLARKCECIRHALLSALAEEVVFRLLLRLKLEHRHHAREYHVQRFDRILKDGLPAMQRRAEPQDAYIRLDVNNNALVRRNRMHDQAASSRADTSTNLTPRALEIPRAAGVGACERAVALRAQRAAVDVHDGSLGPKICR
jgi:hypothetical protein